MVEYIVTTKPKINKQFKAMLKKKYGVSSLKHISGLFLCYPNKSKILVNLSSDNFKQLNSIQFYIWYFSRTIEHESIHYSLNYCLDMSKIKSSNEEYIVNGMQSHLGRGPYLP